MDFGDECLMPDFRIDETAPEHRKLRTAGLAAAGLWAMAGAYCMKEGTDGWVPAYWVGTWPTGKRQAGVLVKVGLWSVEERDGLDGYRFHDFLNYQRSAASIDDERRKARERMTALRAGQSDEDKPKGTKGKRSGDVRANTDGTNDAPRSDLRASSQPSYRQVAEDAKPSPRRDEIAATSDNVILFARTSGERAPNVHDSLSLKAFGPVPEGGSVGRRARKNPPLERQTDNNTTTGDPRRCARHAHQIDDPGPCRACRAAREATDAAQETQRYAEAAARSGASRATARARRLAISSCSLCDDDGYDGKTVCDHDPDSAPRAALASARGVAEIRARLASKPNARPLEVSAVAADAVERARARDRTPAFEEFLAGQLRPEQPASSPSASLGALDPSGETR